MWIAEELSWTLARLIVSMRIRKSRLHTTNVEDVPLSMLAERCQ